MQYKALQIKLQLEPTSKQCYFNDVILFDWFFVFDDDLAIENFPLTVFKQLIFLTRELWEKIKNRNIPLLKLFTSSLPQIILAVILYIHSIFYWNYRVTFFSDED